MNLPLRPALHAEDALLSRLLSGVYPPGTPLPAERELAAELGVTRPTLREALQRLARDGLLDIRQGKSTLVLDPRQAGLRVLSHLMRAGQIEALVPDLLDLRAALLPRWMAAAARQHALELATFLAAAPPQHTGTQEAGAFTPLEYAMFDWDLQGAVARLSGNALAPLLLGSFRDVYAQAGERYFASPALRERSSRYYRELRVALLTQPHLAAGLTAEVAEDSLRLWHATQSQPLNQTEDQAQAQDQAERRDV